MALDGQGPSSTVPVHRCRFVDYTPSAITALAFPPLPLPSIKGKEKQSSKLPKLVPFASLAVGRANGNIELYKWAGEPGQTQSSQSWTLFKTLSGLQPSKVDSLAFAIRYPERLQEHDVPSLADLRLFSSGGGSELIEWDIQREVVKRTISSQGGAIWSISVNPSSSTLALGCEDGSVRLLSLVHDTLSHLRRFDRIKSKLLSIAWGPPVPHQIKERKNTTAATKNDSDDSDSSDDDDDDDDWADSWLVTGCSDSSLRKWDVASGKVVERINVEKTKGERTLVWAVLVAANGTIVSGDSMGLVKFWDPRTCTQLQSHKGHDADVLALAAGPDGRTVYSTGVDQKTTQYSTAESTASSSRWIKTFSRRVHSHDVRALAVWPPYTPLPSSHARKFPIDVAPIITSGGLDMSIIATPAVPPSATRFATAVNPLKTGTVGTAPTFEESTQRRIPYSAPGAIQVARQARLVMKMEERSLVFWRVHPKPEPSVDDEYPLVKQNDSEDSWEKVLEMHLTPQANFQTGAISNDGKWIFVADAYESKLFALEEKNGELRPHRVRDFTNILASALPSSAKSTGASTSMFTPDSSNLILATTMEPYILILDLSESTIVVIARLDDHIRPSKFSSDRVVLPAKAYAHNDKKQTNGGVDVDMENGGDAKSDVDSDSDDEGDQPRVVIASIRRIAVSADGQWLATADNLSRTHVFNLDLLKHHSMLPSFPHTIDVLAFDTQATHHLLLGFPNNTLQLYDVEARQFLPSWSSKGLATAPDPLVGVAFDPRVRGRALLWGSTWMCRVGLDRSSVLGKRQQHDQQRRRKRNNGWLRGGADEGHRAEEGQEQELRMINRYRPVLYVDFFEEGELVVVERPLVDVFAGLPPAFYKPRYGRT